MFSSLDIEHDKALAAKLGRSARAGTSREAAAFGEVIMISVPYRALPEVGKTLGDLIRGKVVIDTCNPFVGRDGEIANWAREKGAGLASAELLPGARLVRAFNAIGASSRASTLRLKPAASPRRCSNLSLRLGRPQVADHHHRPVVARVVIEPLVDAGIEERHHAIVAIG
jgi:hypothetical protein